MPRSITRRLWPVGGLAALLAIGAGARGQESPILGPPDPYPNTVIAPPPPGNAAGAVTVPATGPVGLPGAPGVPIPPAKAVPDPGWDAYQKGDLPGAERELREAAEVARSHDPNSEHTAHLYDHLAWVLVSRGRVKEAEVLARWALQRREQIDGLTDPATAESLTTMATIFDLEGIPAAAEPLYRRALAIEEQAQGLDGANVIVLLDNLATVLHQQNRYDEAETLYRRAIEAHKKTAAKGDESATLYNLGVLLLDRGQAAAAEPVMRESVAAGKQFHGEKNPEYAARLEGLAKALSELGKHDEAAALLDQAAKIIDGTGSAAGPHPLAARIHADQEAEHKAVGSAGAPPAPAAAPANDAPAPPAADVPAPPAGDAKAAPAGDVPAPPAGDAPAPPATDAPKASVWLALGRLSIAAQFQTVTGGVYQPTIPGSVVNGAQGFVVDGAQSFGNQIPQQPAVVPYTGQPAPTITLTPGYAPAPVVSGAPVIYGGTVAPMAAAPVAAPRVYRNPAYGQSSFQGGGTVNGFRSLDNFATGRKLPLAKPWMRPLR